MITELGRPTALGEEAEGSSYRSGATTTQRAKSRAAFRLEIALPADYRFIKLIHENESMDIITIPCQSRKITYADHCS